MYIYIICIYIQCIYIYTFIYTYTRVKKHPTAESQSSPFSPLLVSPPSFGPFGPHAFALV